MAARIPLVIIGAGGFGRETFGLVRDLNAEGEAYELLGFLDDQLRDTSLLDRLGTLHLGPTEAIRDLGAGVRFVVGIGNGGVRRRIGEQVSDWGFEPATLVHPTALIGPDVELGPGCVVAAGAQITTNVRVGRFVHVDRGTQVGHDCVIGDYVTLNPMVTVSGAVTLEAEVNAGTTSTILPGVRVAERVVIGAAAAVVHDVDEPGAVVVGVPARKLRATPGPIG
ncbi:NeuD/PglB/VioB family sugar acetyltransferase [Ammonicoccus fulvus]|uniref:NeuD/PglB/VioB family sugar acetyltransferase n=1 Tax=Ammonicoccus fulvus TaxID=3138240 RepID=A0ABZ3FID0_9ACTN